MAGGDKVPTLTSTCEKLVVEIHKLEAGTRLPWFADSFTDMLDMFGDVETKPKKTNILQINKNVRETNEKWRTRLNIVCSRCPDKKERNRMFDRHGSLFNLSFRCVVRNLTKFEPRRNKEYVRDAIDRESPYFQHVLDADIPRCIRAELMEWECLLIARRRFDDYFWTAQRMEKRTNPFECREYDRKKYERWHHLAVVLRHWRRFYIHCKGFKFAVHRRFCCL